MKTLLFLVMLLCPSIIYAQQPITKDQSGHGQLLLVVPASGTQAELFVRAKDWLFKTYQSGKTVQQFDDKDAGHLVAKARTQPLIWKAPMQNAPAGAFTYDLTIDVKDNKARMLISSITFDGARGYGSMNLASGSDIADEDPNWKGPAKNHMRKKWNEMQQQATTELQLIATSFQQAIGATVPAKSDW